MDRLPRDEIFSCLAHAHVVEVLIAGLLEAGRHVAGDKVGRPVVHVAARGGRLHVVRLDRLLRIRLRQGCKIKNI